MRDKTCIVTGANTGIGKATAIGLASLGAEVIMVCRNKEKGEKAQRQIIKRSKNNSVHLFIADLSSIQDIKDLSKRIHSDFNKIDVLINNAGIILKERKVTVDGLEYQFMVNYLSNFLLVHLLLDLLYKGASSRIINVSSGVHWNGEINFDDLQSEKSYNPHKVYAMTKLAQILFTYKLSKLLDINRITVNALNPGVVATHLLSDYQSELRIQGFFNRLKYKGARQGAETSIYLAASDKVKYLTGKYFVDKKTEQSSALSYNEATANKLWSESLKLCDISEFGQMLNE